VLEVLKGRFYTDVHLVLKKLTNPTMKRQSFGPFSVPLLQHLVIGLLLLKTHLDQHPHLLKLNRVRFFDLLFMAPLNSFIDVCLCLFLLGVLSQELLFQLQHVTI